jgi:DNA-binding NarL/FixJ family response regulator
MKAKFNPEMLKRVQQAGLEYSLCGGFASSDYYVWFNAAMSSEQTGRAHVERFEMLLPWLVRASQRAYPRTLLTDRERSILERRAMGELSKQIAAALGISERTVRMHVQRIKKKLYTDDLVNAVVIAVRSGMLDPSGGA